MFRVKICGVTNVEDLHHAVAADADAIGLNFYEKSPRRVSLHVADEIVRDLAATNVHRVGVFVNKRPEEIEELGNRFTLTDIQLHGDEPSRRWFEEWIRERYPKIKIHQPQPGVAVEA